MLVDVKVPFTRWLEADYGAVFTVVGTVSSDDANVVQAVIFYIIPQLFADLFAAALFAFFARADVEDFSGCMFFFAHGRRANVL